MALSKLLIANRGEIAVRLIRAGADLGLHTLAVHSQDDALSLHTRQADEARALPGTGPAAYLAADAIVAAAVSSGCDAVHPGYGFLAENAGFAKACEDAGLTFVGPAQDTLQAFGDKVRARAIAGELGVPVLAGTAGVTTLPEARTFFEALPASGAMMIKAVAGGGGRGTRAVLQREQLDDAFSRCESEATAAFGNGDLYVERLIRRARHIEVQILGDGTGAVSHFGERECSIQRRYQKIVEIAPAPALPDGLRQRIIQAAVQMASAVNYRSLGTFEFLIDAEHVSDSADFFFIETNARLQVEHTVTEAVTGVDLVQAQLRVADGARLATLNLHQDAVPVPRGYAIQARVNMETMTADGQTRPSGGVLGVFEPPHGPGVRVDTYGYAGYETNPRFDSLLAKVIGHSTMPDFSAAVARTYRALGEFRIEGVPTNTSFLQNLLHHPDFGAGRTYTTFIDDHAAELAGTAESHPQRYFPPAAAHPPERETPPEEGFAGARIDATDPLAVLEYGQERREQPTQAHSHNDVPEGLAAVRAPMQGTVVSLEVDEGEAVYVGQTVAIMDAMKMEHEITAETAGLVREIVVSVGDIVVEDRPLLFPP